MTVDVFEISFESIMTFSVGNFFFCNLMKFFKRASFLPLKQKSSLQFIKSFVIILVLIFHLMHLNLKV